MGHPFERHQQADVPASPDEVWAAIATGPGIDSWFMGRNEVKAGVVRTVFADYAPELQVTDSDPAHRFAYRSGQAPDGRFIAYEFLIEGRAGGSTVLRAVTSGFVPGDDWADEFEAMTLGGELYFRTLVEYLHHFAGRFATPVTAFGPPGATWASERARLYRGLGLTESADRGDPVRVSADEIGTVDGVVYFANAHTVAVRTPDAMYRFLRGFGHPLVAAHQLFAADADPARSEQAWAAWLKRTLVPATETPATETPATETPATETPATETPATETPKEDLT